MEVCIFGATGGTGRAAVTAALAAAHTVSVLVRDPARLGDLAERVSVVDGDVTFAEDVRRAVAGCDAVISALGPDSFRKGGLNSRAVPLVIEAMRATDARRLVVVSGAVWTCPATARDWVPGCSAEPCASSPETAWLTASTRRSW